MVHIEILSITHYGLTGHVTGMEFGYNIKHDGNEEFVTAPDMINLLDSLKPKHVLKTLPGKYRDVLTNSGAVIGGVYFSPAELGDS